MSYKFNIIFQKDENGYFVYCPELKGCFSQGETFEEAKVNIKEAIELFLETLDEDEIASFKPTTELITTTMEVELA
jgi:predicted RNase H-like HicB family nuclease